MWGLGRTFDLGHVIAPVADLAAGANTGARVHMRNYDAIGFVIYKAAASAGTDTVTLTLQEHTAATAGTSANLAAITEWYVKSEATLDGDEAWTRVTQAAAATLALTGATYAATQVMAAFEVNSQALSAGYEWLSVNIADPGAGGTIPGCVFAVMGGLKIQRRPDLLRQPNL